MVTLAKPVYLHDGTVFHLDEEQIDRRGREWLWNGERNAKGEPLMVCRTGSDQPVPLPDVYHHWLPLTPAVHLPTSPWLRGAA